MFHSFHNCCQSFLFSHRNKLGLKRNMKKMQKMQDICNKETKTTAASLTNTRYTDIHSRRGMTWICQLNFHAMLLTYDTYKQSLVVDPGLTVRVCSRTAHHIIGRCRCRCYI